MQQLVLWPGGEPPAVEKFLKMVLRSGLLTREQLQDALRPAPADSRGNPTLLAGYLVKVGKLSRFQARKLLEGVSLGLVLGPYQILAPLGRGGIGVVYLARDTRNQQLVALKVLPPKRARAKEKLLARFLREMELCKRVASPHVAWTHDVGVCQGIYYIAMEFIPGKSLSQLVSSEGPLAVPRAARLFAEVAQALAHAHDQGLIHRDLKPSNIMVTPNDHAKVLDLGMALIEGEIPTDRTIVGGDGYVVGTMDYLAPEQSEDSINVDARTDIYSMGCSLYFALSGRTLFPGGTSLEKIMRHRNEDPEPLRQLSPSIPEAFAALVHRMMAKRPQDRFASAAEVRGQLLAWSSGEPALPLDEAGDSAYQRAVISLANDEGGSVVEEILPVVRARPWRSLISAMSRVKFLATWLAPKERGSETKPE